MEGDAPEMWMQVLPCQRQGGPDGGRNAFLSFYPLRKQRSPSFGSEHPSKPSSQRPKYSPCKPRRSPHTCSNANWQKSFCNGIRSRKFNHQLYAFSSFLSSSPTSRNIHVCIVNPALLAQPSSKSLGAFVKRSTIA